MFLLELEVIQAKAISSRRFTLAEAGKVLVGRLECDLILSDRTVSRRHLGFAVRSRHNWIPFLQNTQIVFHSLQCEPIFRN